MSRYPGPHEQAAQGQTDGSYAEAEAQALFRASAPEQQWPYEIELRFDSH